jgi:hypothetical protein
LDELHESEVHAGVLKSIEQEADEFFEFSGQKLPLKGTSGPQKEPSRLAEGSPIQHDILIAGQPVPPRATSGASQVESRVAEGQPVKHGAGSESDAAGPTGSGQLIGEPVRHA